MKQFVIVGVDVSKSTLDIFFNPAGISMTIANTGTGYSQYLKQLKKLADPQAGILVIMEHTGQYSYRFESFLRSRGIGYCKINALQIKRSLGLIRGKDDRIDARRIADYGWLRRELLTADEPCCVQIRRLRDLLSLRLKLVRDRSGYISRFKEMRASGSCTARDTQGKIHQQTIAFLTRQIIEIEKQIKLLVKSDRELEQDCALLRSIKGIGWIVACSMIGYTERFKRFGNARKFNCYAGLAPFKQESGSSLKTKSRVSHLANKEIKSLLNLAACTAIQHDPEMKEYYQKRVKEGKNKMSCLNIIRAKLVARMFAVIKRQTPYLPMSLAV
jgi:transposase